MGGYDEIEPKLLIELICIADRQIDALKLSLKNKWEPLQKQAEACVESQNDIRPLARKAVSTTDCACCDRYFNVGCFGCPINELTGHAYCVNTPLGEISDGMSPVDFFGAVKAEVSFLTFLIERVTARKAGFETRIEELKKPCT